MYHNTISVHYILSDTQKEIYEFESVDITTWVYKGIMYSNRDGGDDIWGDEWTDHHVRCVEYEYNEICKKHGYGDYDGYLFNDDAQVDYELDCVNKKYNPTCLKTKDGLTRYHGLYSHDLPKPKMSKDDIIKYIKENTQNIELVL